MDFLIHHMTPNAMAHYPQSYQIQSRFKDKYGIELPNSVLVQIIDCIRNNEGLSEEKLIPLIQKTVKPFKISEKQSSDILEFGEFNLELAP